jgi:DNA polymerase-3 subunit epsilon
MKQVDGTTESQMLKHITLSRPLAFIDVETTGLDPQRDRIVEVAILKFFPEGRHKYCSSLLNPAIPIPAEASAIHGITDADVAAAPRFAQIVDDVLAVLDGCDLAGFAVTGFHLCVLDSEVKRADRVLSLEGRAVVDVMDLYHRQERGGLPAAVRHYLGTEHPDHHRAAADALAAAQVLDAMVVRHEDLPHDVEQLHRLLLDRRVDSRGFFERVGGEVRFAKTMHKGRALQEVARESPSYLTWMLGQSFAEDTKEVVRQALAARQSPCIPSSASPGRH